MDTRHRHWGGATAVEHRIDDAHVAQIDNQTPHARDTQRIQRQFQHFQVGLEPRVAVNLRAELQRLAAAMRGIHPRVQHGTAVAQPGDPLPVE